jgi:NAD(P)-dependent dehydrogenase (short-subunit alcohol dehydrogenase family)
MRTFQQLMDLRGRVACITGGAGHLGRAMGETLAELGAHVVVIDLSEEHCRESADALQRDYGVRALPLPLDLADEQALRRVPEAVAGEFGRLDILVNCAALVGSSVLKGWVTPFREQASEAWRLALEVNLTAPFLLTQACADLLGASGKGSVINVSSIYGVAGPDMRLYEGTAMGNPAAYGASKGGLLQLTRWLATVMAPSVRVNAITPGGVWRGQPEVFQQRYVERTPLRRMAIEEDFKGAIGYLAGDLSAYVTAQNLIVDGGWTAW